ncbi:MAG: hypothetical protein V1853_04905 [bacterium]
MGKKIYWFSIASLIVLIAIELIGNYDRLSRQFALSFTALVVLVLVLSIRKYFVDADKLLGATALAASLGVWFDALGNFWQFYSKFLWWDKVAHGVGAAAAAVAVAAFFLILQQRGKLQMSLQMHWFIWISVTMLLASIYEITELFGDEWFGLDRLIDIYDTPDDLRWNLLGAMIAGLIIISLHKGSKIFAFS